MITTIDLHRALQETLSAKYSSIEFKNSDNETPTRPSFYINYLNGTDKRIATQMELKSATFEVIYYASNAVDNYLELLAKKDELERVFKMPLETIACNNILEAGVINVEFDIDKKNGNLSAVVDIQITQKVDADILNNSESRYDKAQNTNIENIEELTIEKRRN